VEVRIPAKNEQTIYIVEIMKRNRRMLINNMKSVPKLLSKVLYHWHISVTYQTLSLFEIRASIECADALNSFNEDVLEQKIDDYV